MADNRRNKKIEVYTVEDGVIILQGEQQVFVSRDALPRLIALLVEAVLGLSGLDFFMSETRSG